LTPLTRQKRPPLFLFLLAVGLALVPHSLTESPLPEGSASPVNEAVQTADESLLRLSGLGRFAEVLELGRSRLANGPRTCLLAELTAQSAARTGRLNELAVELQEALRQDMDDDILLIALALALQEQQAYGRAGNLLALAIRRGVPCPEAYLDFVELNRNRGRLREAEAVLSRLAAQRPTDPYVLLARAYSSDLRGDGSRALADYQQAILRAPPLALTHRHYSRLLVSMGLFERAANASRTAVRLARAVRKPRQLAPLLTLEGVSLDALGLEEESGQAFEEALAVSRDYSLFSLEARILIEMSILSGARGRMDASLAYLARARALEDRLYSPVDKMRYLNRLGSALASLARSAEATAAFEESAALARAHGDPIMEADARFYLAAQMLSSGAPEALDVYQSAYQQTVALEDGRGQGRALSGLGAVQERMGSYASSLEYYQRALELATRAGDRYAEAIALSNIGLVHFRLNQPSRALVYSARATQLAGELKDVRLQASLLNGLAVSLAGLGQLQQSEQVYRRALDAVGGLSSPDLEGLILAGWARVVLALGDTRQALEGFERARVLARQANNTLVSVQAHFGLGQCYARQQDLERATTHFEETLTLVESMRSSIPNHSERMSYLETRTEVYTSLAAVLLQRDRIHPGNDYREKAFQVVERSRARALLDVLSLSRETEIASPGATVAARAPETLDSSRLRRQVLRPGDVLLEYTLGESQSFLWALTQNDLRVFELPPRREIETVSHSLLRTIRTPPRSPMNLFESHFAPARELFDMLLAPVRDLLQDEPHLIIVPDGILHHLPFEVLAEPNGQDRPRYLVEMANVSYSPSASVLGYLRLRPHRSQPALEFLGVAQPGGRVSTETVGAGIQLALLPPLPYTSLEVERVARLFPAVKRRIQLGPAATESAVKAIDLSRFRILHFAAHAATDEVFPERSAILLGAGSDGEDGLLRMGEVLNLHLASDLVVLSGCQTGVGQLLRAEGTLGFTWAFLSAGSSQIAVSLWGVNDRSTSELMETFYSRMSQGQPTTTALRRAKRSMLTSERKAFRHPYFWAPFVLVGA